MIVRGAAVSTLILLAALLPSAAGAKTLRATIAVPVPSRLDLQGVHRLLVTRMIVDKELPDFDLNKETIALLRSKLRKRTTFNVLDVEPPPLPEQPLPDLLANSGFWRRLAGSHEADLVIAGKISFEVADRSGYVQVDETSPVTGQRVRRTRFIDREGFTLRMNLFFFRGSTGQLLYEDHFTGENTLNGAGNDRLTALFTVFEQFEDDVLGILTPMRRTAQRTLFTD
ncbi:MAG TPA: hypothetical protein VGA64_09690 [Candidatus Polarisedimenticolia bacterium]